MSKNIGFTKKFATRLAKSCNTEDVEAYAQREDHWGSNPPSHQFVVVMQRRGKK